MNFMLDVSVCMGLNRTKHMYTFTVRLHRMIYVLFHGRRINMPMSLNGTEHMHMITAGLYLMIYKASYLDLLICLCFPKIWKACI
jgi:hypothetical protein